MIISRTPLRISFCGGGTDLKNYWEDYGGAVVSTTIDKYIEIAAKKRIDNQIWLKYSENEIVNRFEEIMHTRWRECLRDSGFESGIELCALSDIPKGTGLGGSSSFTVGSLNCLYNLAGRNLTKEELARKACEVEINFLGEPIGKQDQYAAAYGGLNLIEFDKGGGVSVKKINLSGSTKETLSSNLLLFNLGMSRKASSILSGQNSRTKAKAEVLHKMKEFAYSAKKVLEEGDLRSFGRLLHENWIYKKRMSEKISNKEIDRYYNSAIMAGALGGKVCGAGGGGFLMFYVEEERKKEVRESLSCLDELIFNFEEHGTKIIFQE